MVRQMWNVLQDYKKCKAGLDKRYQESEKKALNDRSERYLNEVWKPTYKTAYLNQCKILKAATLDQIQRIAENAETLVDYATSNTNYYNILLAKSLKDIELTEREQESLIKRFSDDVFAERVFISELNEKADPLHQRALPYPENTLDVVNRMLADAGRLIDSYSETFDMTTPEGRMAFITVQNIENRFGDYTEILDSGYFSDSDLDSLPPLTAAEEREIDNLFSGCKDSRSKRQRASELAEQGFTSLIKRSAYADNLPEFYKNPPTLDSITQCAICITETATTTRLEQDEAKEMLGKYADCIDNPDNKKSLDVLNDWSKDHGFSGYDDNKNTSINADTLTDNTETASA